MDRDSAIEMLVNRHAAARQALTPARLGDLKHASLELNRVVLIDQALTLQTEHPVQVLPSAGDKGGTRLTGLDGKLLVELRDVALPQEVVGLNQGSDLGTSQLLRQSSLPGTIVAFHPAPRLRRIGWDQSNAELL